VQERLLLHHHDFSLHMMKTEYAGTPLANPVAVLARWFVAGIALAIYLIWHDQRSACSAAYKLGQSDSSSFFLKHSGQSRSSSTRIKHCPQVFFQHFWQTPKPL
jgi:hypothetical protein